MQLPKFKKKKREKLKICQEPGCGKEFWGHPISKYCEVHRIIGNRKRVRVISRPYIDRNQEFVHNFKDVISIEFTCQAPGCGRKYRCDIYPKQTIYPKYCEEHRSDYKRELFKRTFNNGLQKNAFIGVS